jgi:hypothetical protein
VFTRTQIVALQAAINWRGLAKREKV